MKISRSHPMLIGDRLEDSTTPPKISNSLAMATETPSASVIETPPISSTDTPSKATSKTEIRSAERELEVNTPNKPVQSIPTSTPSTEPPRHRERLTARRPKDKHREPPKAIVDADDMFDMFSYDYEQPEFGVMPKQSKNRQTKNAGNDDTVDLDDTVHIEKQQNADASNANFDFVEACQTLRTQIESAKNEEADDDAETSAVNMSDIDGMQMPHSDKSLDALSIQSTIGSSHNQSELAELEEVIHNLKISDDADKAEHTTVYLASGSVESCVCIWDIHTGRIVDKIQFKASHNRPPIPSKLIDL